jgi:putative NADPH-quinone reductase
MAVSIILGHPKVGSFNHAIANTIREQLMTNGYEVNLHDLYTESFDPLLITEELPKQAKLPKSIQTHCDEIKEAEGIFIVHPNWWGQPPAILKGWIDRVIRSEVAYRFVGEDGGEGVPEGLLKAKTAVVFNTSDTNTERENQVFGDPLERIWKDCIFGLCGVTNFYRRTFNIIVLSNQTQREKWLEDVKVTVDKHFPKKL